MHVWMNIEHIRSLDFPNIKFHPNKHDASSRRRVESVQEVHTVVH